jgi:hypothetical protein
MSRISRVGQTRIAYNILVRKVEKKESFGALIEKSDKISLKMVKCKAGLCLSA